MLVFVFPWSTATEALFGVKTLRTCFTECVMLSAAKHLRGGFATRLERGEILLAPVVASECAGEQTLENTRGRLRMMKTCDAQSYERGSRRKPTSPVPSCTWRVFLNYPGNELQV